MRQLVMIGCSAFALMVVLCARTQAAINIDGILSDDWDVSISGAGYTHGAGRLVYGAAYVDPVNGHATYSPASNPGTIYSGTAVIDGREVIFQVEDSNDLSNSYRLGPLFGGENYDAEGLFASIHENNLYIAIATGQRVDNGNGGDPHKKYFSPGDISIVLPDAAGGSVYGIEVGGGLGGQTSANYVITEDDPGTTYRLFSNGYTNFADDRTVTDDPNAKAGSVWLTGSASDWIPGLGGSGIPRTQLTGGTHVPATVDYAYNFGVAADGTTPLDFGEHAFIELCISNYADVFDHNLKGATVHWYPSCGNDELGLSVDLPVPEPATLVVWSLLGGFGIAVGLYRRRRRA